MLEPGQLLKLRDSSGKEVFVYTDYLVAAFEFEPPGEGMVTKSLGSLES